MRTPIRFAAMLLIVAASATASQAACMRCQPIMNVTDASVVAPSGKTLSTEDVRAAIVRAGASLGWQIKDEGPGKLVGTLVLRTHMAVVDLSYTATSYSIVYKSSVNLDEGEGQIHGNYNGWISNLHKAIGAQLLLV